ncbi:CHAT domain-containing protein [Allocoleopsis franciscana]|uniref:CHAT domain-containing protein n=1 Tax=Allocoleopsis franciscana PCC 7113 TaxID=1173027 RepID=K9WKN8_9CYAN|nr:CHAT domain-containing protein [Allocoleopsis franciscana]AFZ20753.1 hypothetical protein Mic7113_5096 [Allocoleopsis franciscana PCC 7113]
MRSRPKHLSFIAATLLLSLTFPLQLSGIHLSISTAIAAKSTQDSEIEKDKFSVKTFPRVNRGTFQTASSPSAVEKETSSDELQQRLEELQTTLVIQRKNGDRAGEVDTLNKIAKTLGYIGNAYFKAGKYRQIEELFRQKLESFRKIGDGEGEQLILDVMRRHLKQKWQFQAAFGVARDISLRRRKLSWQEQLSISQLNLFISQEIGDRKAQQHSLHSMGWVYRNLGQYSQALGSYQQSLAIARERKVKDHELFLLIETGLIYNDLAQYERALEVLDQALSILPSVKVSEELVVPISYLEPFALNQIGLIYKKLGQVDRALQFFQQALSKESFERHHIYNNIGLIYFEKGQYTQALEAYQKSQEYGNSGDLSASGFILNSIGLVYAQTGDYTQALEAYRKALALFREFNDRPGERTTLSNIGSLLEKQNQPELAIVFYKEAVNITEAIRQDLQKLTIEEQKVYTETVADNYRSLANLLLSQGRILEAQQVLELLKVQELRNFTKDTRTGGKETLGIITNFTESEILKTHGTLIALGRKIEECKQCAERSKLLDQREAVAKEFEDNVRSLEQEISRRREKDKAFLDPSTLGGNAEAIVSEPGTVLIYPLVLENKLWILWASKGGITKSIEVPQVGLKQLSEKVVQFRQLLQNPNSDIAELKATGKQLYDWLLPPSLQKELKKNQIQNLVFSLDRVTRYIPMNAVFDGEKYLTENYNISTIISANLTQMGERLPPGTQNTSVLAAGLSEAKKGFNPLPNVPAELNAIIRQSPTDTQGIYPGLQLLNQGFNRKALRDNLADHLILHIATHGKFVPNNAYASYLLLGDGEELPIPEIQNMRDLNQIHLVVLSACETALGETGQDGTEITGLSYYFLEKGAKAVMASLWQVNDKSTRLLMEQFYSTLAKGTAQSPITKAQALRQAQLSLIRSDHPKGGTVNNPTSTANTDFRGLGAQPIPGRQSTTSNASGFSHPYYWAPFILIGNGL